MNKKIKMLLCTDSAAIHSGLAESLRNIFIPLINMYPEKYEIHQLGFFNFAPKEQIPWPIYNTRVKQGPRGPEPDMDDKYGEHTFHPLVQKIQPDICFGYGDMWHFNHLLHSPVRNTYRLCVYYTIDGQPYFGHLEKNGETHWGRNLQKADQIVTLSHFGKEALKAGCPELKDSDIKVMYHPLETNRYPVINDEQKLKIKRGLLPAVIAEDSFVIGWLGRNQFRKQNYKLWETLHYLVYGDYIECQDCKRITLKEWNHSSRCSKDPDKYPGELNKLTFYDQGYKYDHCWHCKSSNISSGTPIPNLYMWFHMPKNDPGYNPDLHQEMWRVSDRCLYSSDMESAKGISKQDLALLISTWDCMYYPSGGEGFGNPPFEAMAAGVPVVYSDYSSHAEFCRFGGLPVRVTYVPEVHHGIMRSAVDTAHAVEQLLKLYRDKELRKLLGNKGRVHTSQYSLEQMAPVWDSIFTEMMTKPLPMNSDNLYVARI